jgi:hypothetical protein
LYGQHGIVQYQHPHTLFPLSRQPIQHMIHQHAHRLKLKLKLKFVLKQKVMHLVAATLKSKNRTTSSLKQNGRRLSEPNVSAKQSSWGSCVQLRSWLKKEEDNTKNQCDDDVDDYWMLVVKFFWMLRR